MTKSKIAPNKTLIILKVKLIFRDAGLLFTEGYSHSPQGIKLGPLGSRMIIPRKKALDYFSLISSIGFLTKFTLPH